MQWFILCLCTSVCLYTVFWGLVILVSINIQTYMVHYRNWYKIKFLLPNIYLFGAVIILSVQILHQMKGYQRCPVTSFCNLSVKTNISKEYTSFIHIPFFPVDMIVTKVNVQCYIVVLQVLLLPKCNQVKWQSASSFTNNSMN